MEIWGWKTISLFDVWSLEHFIGGITLGSIIFSLQKKKGDKNSFKALLIVAAIAYIWEYIEFHLEIGDSGIQAVTYWFQGVEFWANRLITDPFLVLMGAYVSNKKTATNKPARIFSSIWLGIHIFIFPHCMVLHTLF